MGMFDFYHESEYALILEPDRFTLDMNVIPPNRRRTAWASFAIKLCFAICDGLMHIFLPISLIRFAAFFVIAWGVRFPLIYLFVSMNKLVQLRLGQVFTVFVVFPFTFALFVSPYIVFISI